MPIHLTLFGQLTDLTHSSRITIPDVPDTDTLQKILIEQYPDFSGKKFAVAVDKQIVTTNTPLTEHSMVALLPPFSGG